MRSYTNPGFSLSESSGALPILPSKFDKCWGNEGQVYYKQILDKYNLVLVTAAARFVDLSAPGMGKPLTYP
jgi:hypothetical protein